MARLTGFALYNAVLVITLMITVGTIPSVKGDMCKDYIPFDPMWCDGDNFVSNDCWVACRKKYQFLIKATCGYFPTFPGSNKSACYREGRDSLWINSRHRSISCGISFEQMEGNITRMELDKLVADENKAGNEADGVIVVPVFYKCWDASVNLNIEYDCFNEAATWNSMPNAAA
ncbi:hypothetical protein Tco_0348643 [Tanacetum coccineum]